MARKHASGYVQGIWRLARPMETGDAPELMRWPWPLRQLLFNRGLRTARDVEAFLHPERVGLHDPFLMAGMGEAVEIVRKALGGGRLIAVYGDFDVDGLTATALVSEVLSSAPLNGRVVSYLPHRQKDGYGLHGEAIRTLAAQGAGLLITVDCGIGAHDEVRLAAELGMDVIVTDHHRVPGRVPDGATVLNPRQEVCRYPSRELSGVGVAYKLGEALLSTCVGMEEARRLLEQVLDLVALGTVADLAPLVGENRLLVKLGLQRMNQGARTGLRAMATAGGFQGRPVDAEGVGWRVAPRLNAAGRMGDARLSLKLLTTKSEAEAAGLASELETANRDRQDATMAALESARGEMANLRSLPPAIVLAGDYPAGIVGLVAGRLAEEFGRPAFVIELGDGESRGSGRGVAGFDVVAALSEAEELLLRYGGHPQAGGFALPSTKIPTLKARLERAAERQLGAEPAPAELLLEADLRARDLGPDLFNMVEMLEPVGVGNEPPVFQATGMQVRDVRTVGSGHLRLRLADESGTVGAIGFGMATEEYAFVRVGSCVDTAFRVGRSEWGGTVRYEMRLRELRPSADAR